MRIASLLLVVLTGAVVLAPAWGAQPTPAPAASDAAARPAEAAGTGVPADASHAGQAAVPTASLWSRWTSGAIARRDEARLFGTALLQQLRLSGPWPADATAGAAATGARAAASPAPPAAEPSLPAGTETVPVRPGAWRFGVERTAEDPHAAQARPARLRVTVAREWPI